MTRRFGILFFCVFSLVGAARADFAEEQRVAIDAIVRLVQEGVSDDVVIKHIQANGFQFDLTADDLIELKQIGVSDAVLAAMLDTALESEPEKPKRSRQRVYDRESYDSPLYVTVSAGYFSPWYWYPYAWGFYYDPFPYCYSYYYYPFRSHYNWGYYGYCRSYYYRHWWPSYRYDHASYYARTRHRQGSSVRVPVRNESRQLASSGLRNVRHARSNAVRAPRSRSVDAPAPVGRTLRERSTRDRIHVRERPRDAQVREAPSAPPAPHPARPPRRVDTPAPPSRDMSPPRQVETPSPPPPRARAPQSGSLRPAPSLRPPASSPRGAAPAAPAPPPPRPSSPAKGSRPQHR